VYSDNVDIDQNFCRAFAHVALMSGFVYDHHLFKKSRELEKVRLWLTRHCGKSHTEQSYVCSIWLLAFNFARATENLDNVSKKRMIIQAFDDILVQGIDGIVTLKLLATQILHWYNNISINDNELALMSSSLSCLLFPPVDESSGLKQLCPHSLPHVMEVVLIDFPIKLRSIATDLGIVDVIGNSALQIVASLRPYVHLSDPRYCEMIAMLDGVCNLCHGKSYSSSTMSRSKA